MLEKASIRVVIRGSALTANHQDTFWCLNGYPKQNRDNRGGSRGRNGGRGRGHANKVNVVAAMANNNSTDESACPLFTQ